MKSYRVKDLMVPLSEYATVTQAATLLDAVQALRKAQDAFSQSRYQHRAILVIDENNHFVGKLSQHDVLEALAGVMPRGARLLGLHVFRPDFLKPGSNL